MVHLSYNNRMCQNEQQKIFSGPKNELQRLDHPQESKLLKYPLKQFPKLEQS